MARLISTLLLYYSVQSLLARSKCHIMDCTYHFLYLTGSLYWSTARAELQRFCYNTFGTLTIGHIFSRLSPGLLFAGTIYTQNLWVQVWSLLTLGSTATKRYKWPGLHPQFNCGHNNESSNFVSAPCAWEAEHLKTQNLFYPGIFNSHFYFIILWAPTISPHLLFFFAINLLTK